MAVDKERKRQKRKGKAITWKEKVYIFNLVIFYEEILQAHHDQELVEHPKYTKTHKLVI